nr:putative odorant receptor 65c [Drosophila kikkawai]
MVLYTNSEERRLPYRSLWHTFTLIQFSIMFITMCYGLTESLGDIVEMGRDLAFILGIFFISFKIVYFHWYADGLDKVIDDLEAHHHWLREGPGYAEARKTRRWHCIMVVPLLTLWSFFMALFIILVLSSPLWVAQQTLPIHAKYPFDLHNKSKHPRTHALCYLSQVYFFLVSLSVFEALIARKDPKVAFQFGVLMLLALGHLSLWSKFGDLMSQESLDIALAAYETYNPQLGSKISRDLCIMIRRAQDPMQMVARPFPPFNLKNYTATFFIHFKLIYFHWYADSLDEVIDELEACHQWLREGPGSAEARSVRRWHCIVFFLMVIFFSFFTGIFVILLNTTPLWVAQQNLPLHTIYPFEWHSRSKHPIAHGISYLTQAVVLTYAMIWLLLIDGLSVSIYFEITCAIKVLCIELRHVTEKCQGNGELLRREVNRLIGLHQKILSILDRTNEVFHGTLKMQVIANFFLVSLSVFEALMARKDPKVAFQFGVLMLLALGHLSMWSKFGDIMSQESLDIALAAYEAYDPQMGSKISRDLCIMIRRAQDPMQMVARPFPPFNLKNYTAILNQCYSILTLLLNTLD